MPVKLKQISTVFAPTPQGGNLMIIALDEDGQMWQWMRNTWGKMKNPIDKDKKAEG